MEGRSGKAYMHTITPRKKKSSFPANLRCLSWSGVCAWGDMPTSSSTADWWQQQHCQLSVELSLSKGAQSILTKGWTAGYHIVPTDHPNNSAGYGDHDPWQALMLEPEM